jgi:5-methylcytosine-specific restriction endonuclease McrA
VNCLARTATQKPRPRILSKWQKQLEKDRQWRDVSKVVRKRDGGKCRSCKKPGSQLHHIVYRSHGGKDVAANLILTCDRCHAAIHAKVILVKFTLQNPAASITFTLNTQWDDISEKRGR